MIKHQRMSHTTQAKFTHNNLLSLTTCSADIMLRFYIKTNSVAPVGITRTIFPLYVVQAELEKILERLV